MNKIRVYNDFEIGKLLNNPNILGIKNKSQIIYKDEFKLWAVKEKLSDISKTARQIFVAGGFDMNILDDRTPQKRLCTWIKKYKMFGEDYFTNKNSYTYKALPKSNNKFLNKVFNDPNTQVIVIEKKNDGTYTYKIIKRFSSEENNR